MKTIYFRKAGLIPTNLDNFFLTSKHRVKVNSTIFHNNDYSTEYRFPVEFFKRHFVYNRSTGIYKTNLCNKDVARFSNVIKHG